MDKYELLDKLLVATKANIVGLLQELKKLDTAEDIMEIADRVCSDKSTLLSEYSDKRLILPHNSANPPHLVHS